MQIRKNFLDDKQFNKPCPQCGQMINKTIGWLKTNDYICPGCRQVFKNTKLRAQIDEIYRKLQGGR